VLPHPSPPRAPRRIPALPGYAELACRSSFSFLTGASHPEELVARAKALRYAALAITDECSLGGVVRAHAEAKRLGLPLIVGATLQLAPPVPARVPSTGGGRKADAARGGTTIPTPACPVRAWCGWRSRAVVTATSPSGSPSPAGAPPRAAIRR